MTRKVILCTALLCIGMLSMLALTSTDFAEQLKKVLSSPTRVEQTDFTPVAVGEFLKPEASASSDVVAQASVITAEEEMAEIQRLSSDNSEYTIGETMSNFKTDKFENPCSKPLTPRVVSTISKAPRLAGSVAESFKTGAFMSKNYSTVSDNSYYSVSITKDGDDYYIKGLFEVDTISRMTVDLDNGTVSIPAQKLYEHSVYGAIWICPVDWTAGSVSFTGSISGTISDNGSITLGGWGVFIAEGTYKGSYFDAFTSTELVPSNATFKYDVSDGTTLTVESLIEQTSENQCVLYQFGSVGAPVTARINSDGTMTIPPQYIFNNSYYGDFYCYYYDASTSKVNTSNMITATCGNGVITVDGFAICLSGSSTTAYRKFNSLVITTDYVITLPKSKEFNLEGDGSATNPYMVKSADDIAALAESVNSGNAYRDKVFQVANDIDMSSATGSYIAIGTNTTPFRGTFDGANHTISNLTIESTGFSYQGLFGFVDTVAVVKDLKLTGLYLKGVGNRLAGVAGQNNGVISNVAVSGNIYTGGQMGAGIAGFNVGTIENCSFSGLLEGVDYVGGIVGYSTSASKVTGCTCDARINYTEALYTVHATGGIAGVAYGSLSNSRQCVVSDCLFSGQIVDNTGYCKAGGIVGYATSSIIERCLFVGYISTSNYANNGQSDDYDSSITGVTITDNSTGGIAASTVSLCEIYDCVSAGTILKSKISNRVGGIVGYYSAGYVNSQLYQASIVERCLNTSFIRSYPNYTREHRGIWGQTWEKYNIKPAETTFKYCYSDNQATGFRDDVYGVNTADLISGTLPEGFSSDVWVATAGQYPTLKKFAGTKAANLAATNIAMEKGETVAKFKTTATINTTSDISVLIYDGENGKFTNSTDALSISGNQMKSGTVYETAILGIVSSDGSIFRYSFVSTVPNTYKGKGTADDPYVLTTVDECKLLNSGITNCAQTHYGDYFKLGADIDFNYDSEFGGFGASTSTATTFEGVFDGDGHTISRLKVKSDYITSAGKADTGAYPYCGLFHMISAAGVVKNITIAADCQFDCYQFGGAIAGYNAGRIENCYNYADVSSYGQASGGIVGGNYTGGVVTGCYNAGTIRSSAGAVGGIAGYNLGTTELSQNDGYVYADSIYEYTATGTQTIAGGIAGLNNVGVIDRCVNNGAVSTYTVVGGIAGGHVGNTTTGYISNCINTGVVTSWGSDNTVGGFIGSNSTPSYVSLFENNYYDASINPMGAVGCSSFTNVTGATTAELVAGVAPSGISTEDFNLTEGKYPSLAKFANEAATVANRSTYVLFKDKNTVSNLVDSAALVTSEKLTWKLAQGKVFSIDNNVLKVSASQVAVYDTLTAVYDNKYTKNYYLSFVPVSFDGEGTEESPYLIKNTDDLNLLASNVNEYLMDYDGVYFKVTNDIVYANNDTTFNTISEPSGASKFNGVFDGDGHSIGGYSIEDKSLKYLGFFGTIGMNGVVKNLTLKGYLAGSMYTGGFAGMLYGTIDNCVFAGEVTAGTSNAAGFVGKQYAGSTIKNSVNKGMVGVRVIGTYAPTLVGGIVAEQDTVSVIENCHNESSDLGVRTSVGGIASKSNGTIRNCYNTGDITATSNAAGIVAQVQKYCLVENCYNTGTIDSGTNNGASGIGATSSASNQSRIVNCYNTGTIKGKGTVGGIQATAYAGLTIENCYNTGSISANGSAYIGGIIGTSTGSAAYATTIKNCWNSGEISNAFNDAGGIAGYLYAYGVISNCYNTGKVSIEATVSRNGAGGIAGLCAGSISDSWNSGEISCTGYGAGGIVGTSSNAAAVYTNNFNLGDVVNTASIGNPNSAYIYGNAGGILGTSSAKFTMTNCGNFGKVSAPSHSAGIAAGVYQAASITNCFNVGKVTADNDSVSSTFMFYIYKTKTCTPSKITTSGIYYDSTVNSTPGLHDANYTALSSNEFTTVNIEGFENIEACYPTLKSFADVAQVNLAIAYMTFSGNDDVDNVNESFTVGLPTGVTWTSSDNLSVADDGKVTLKSSGEAWLKATVVVDGNELSKTYTLTVKGLSTGIDGVTAGKVVVDQVYYDLSGCVTKNPVLGNFYIVKTVYEDGTSTVSKKLVK